MHESLFHLENYRIRYQGDQPCVHPDFGSFDMVYLYRIPIKQKSDAQDDAHRVHLKDVRKYFIRRLHFFA